MNEVAARTVAVTHARTRVSERQLFWAGTAAISAALAGLLGWFLLSWPPHEDEALALFVGRDSFVHVIDTVIMERGGAPLHFVFAWVVVHAGGGLTALRVVSLVFAVGSIPLIALLGARLSSRAVGVVAAALAAGTWALIFHGIYGRMYSLFLFTSLLSFLALLSALERAGKRRFVLWGLALLATLASHPYAVLVVAAQAVFVAWRRVHLREALATLLAVAVLGTPFWWADVVLRGRFDVGIGGGGAKLGSPGSVVHYFWATAGDFAAGHQAWSAPVLALALVGALLLARRRLDSFVLTACVVVVPALAFTLATLNSSTSPESRHLIFALPFFSILLAIPLVELALVRPPVTAALASAALAVLLVGELRWAHEKTPALFDGRPAAQVHARETAGTWLASTARTDDVLLGYEPLFLQAWESNRAFSSNVIPRADPHLFASKLTALHRPLGRGVWVFDASDTTNLRERSTVPLAAPQPRSAFEARVFGPYLVIRSRESLRTPARYVVVSEQVMRLGRRLEIADADVNLKTMLQAESRLGAATSLRSSAAPRSPSTISR